MVGAGRRRGTRVRLSPEQSLVAAAATSAHRAHILLVAVPTLTMAAVAAIADLRARFRRTHRQTFVGNRAVLAVAAACSLLAMAIHVSVAPEHYREDVLFGVFFTVTAACQLGWALIVALRPTRLWLAVGNIGNALIVALWSYTRFVAVPLGPEAGSREEIGARDVMATCVEVLLVLTTAWLLVRTRRERGTARTAPAVAPVREVELVG
jgi:hypothetical protein